MKEQKIDVVIIAVECDPFLTLDEGETGSELKDETLDFTQDSGLQVLFT